MIAEVALTILAVVAGSLRLPGVTMADLGYRNDTRSAWTIDDETPRLLAAAGTLPQTCWVAVLSHYLTSSGGYSYLHRDVPLASTRGTPGVGDWRRWANVVVARATRVPAGYRTVVRVGSSVAAERGGSCVAPPPAVRSRLLPAPTVVPRA